jgi:hypothetical protein
MTTQAAPSPHVENGAADSYHWRSMRGRKELPTLGSEISVTKRFPD